MTKMNLGELRNRYLKFFEKRGHVIIPSAPLIPENDPTTLFTGSGMQPLLNYFLGESHPAGTRVVDAQKCFRAEDIPEVGDNRHTTFFEMLGNWSFGDYFKEEQLAWYFEFLTDDLEIPAGRLYVTVFSGDEKHGLPRDSDSAEIWKKLFAKKGIEAKEVVIGSPSTGSVSGTRGGRIFYYDSSKNWWSRSGAPNQMPVGEPGGPDSEVFYDFSTPHNERFGKYCHPNCDCGRFMEIGNSVFMEYKKTARGFEKLPRRNVDFGGGLERSAAALQNNPDIFLVADLRPAVEAISAAAGLSYLECGEEARRRIRIIADHLRGAIFMLSDGLLPGNKEQGYILRRLLRRAYFNARRLNLNGFDWIEKVLSQFIYSYGDYYTDIADRRENILKSLTEEAKKFFAAVDAGVKMLKKIAGSRAKKITGEEAFTLFSTHGFPFELTAETATEMGLTVDGAVFQKLLEKHQDLSRAGAAQKFKGGLADGSEEVVRYHTATHLLHQALRDTLGDHVAQKGSNITKERLRFDFSHPAKLTEEEKQKVEEIVNQKIKEALPVHKVVLPRAEAEKSGALHFFGEKYGDMITIHFVGDSLEAAYSKEFCGGPHVKNISELGVFKIMKEEAVSAGVRRIKAVLTQADKKVA